MKFLELERSRGHESTLEETSIIVFDSLLPQTIHGPIVWSDRPVSVYLHEKRMPSLLEQK